MGSLERVSPFLFRSTESIFDQIGRSEVGWLWSPGSTANPSVDLARLDGLSDLITWILQTEPIPHHTIGDLLVALEMYRLKDALAEIRRIELGETSDPAPMPAWHCIPLKKFTSFFFLATESVFDRIGCSEVGRLSMPGSTANSPVDLARLKNLPDLIAKILEIEPIFPTVGNLLAALEMKSAAGCTSENHSTAGSNGKYVRRNSGLPASNLAQSLISGSTWTALPGRLRFLGRAPVSWSIPVSWSTPVSQPTPVSWSTPA